jgi:adenosylcobyric acid synthase
VVLEHGGGGAPGRVTVACPILPRISNFDDLDPLRAEPEVELVMVPPGRPIPAEAALIVLAGSKATIADLAALRGEGWDVDILAHHRRGRPVLGLCGGYQMLGRRIADPHAIEGPAGETAGLGLLDVTTVLTPAKTLRAVAGEALGGAFTGYEMHIGDTTGTDAVRPFARFADGRTDGAIAADGLAMGTYVHGLLAAPGLRGALLARIGATGHGGDHRVAVDRTLDGIAAVLEAHLDIDGLLALAG